MFTVEKISSKFTKFMTLLRRQKFMTLLRQIIAANLEIGFNLYYHTEI